MDEGALVLTREGAMAHAEWVDKVTRPMTMDAWRARFWGRAMQDSLDIVDLANAVVDPLP